MFRKARRTIGRKWALGLLLSIGALVAAASLPGTASAAPPPNPPAPPAAQPSFTIMTYNVVGAIRNQGLSRWLVHPDHLLFLEHVADTIREAKAQIVLLQEVCESQVHKLVGILGGAGYVMNIIVIPSERTTKPEVQELCPRDPTTGLGGGFGHAILSRMPGVPIEGPLGTRATCARLEGPPPLRVCDFHINPEEVAATAEAFRAWPAEEPLILAGDFNAEPGSPEMDGMYSDLAGGDGYLYEVDMCPGDPECRAPRRGGAGTTPLPRIIREGLPRDFPLPRPRKIDYIFVDDLNFARQMTARVVQPSCGIFHECSDHALLIGKVRLRAGRSEHFAALAGLWLGIGGEVAHDFSVLRIRPDGSINDRDLWDSNDGLFSSGQLVDRGGGRYSATLHFPLPGVDPRQLRIEVIDCGAPRRRFPFCLSDTGLIELYVEGDYGYSDMFNRLKCGGGVDRPPDLPPLSGPYASPCEYNTGRP